MEKETIRKIELLKEIKPSKAWVSSTRKQFVEEESSVSVLFRPAMALTGAFVLFLGMGLLQTVVAPLYEEGYHTAEEGNGGVMIAAEEDVTEKREFTAAQMENIYYELGEVEKQYKQIQKEVLGSYVMATMVDDSIGVMNERRLNDKEIAEHLLLEMERAYSLFNKEERELFSEAEEAFENEDYERVLDIFLSLR